LRVQILAVLTKFVTGVSPASFIRRNVVSRRAFVVIVIPPFIDRLLYLIDGIEWQDDHIVVLLINDTSLAPSTL
jgi:hypothetical protein